MQHIESSWIALFSSFILTFIFVKLLNPVAFKVQLVDYPGGRKQHPHPTPVIGGIAMFLGACLSMLIMQESLLSFRGLIFGSTLLVFIGVLDDIHEISAKGRLIAQIIALSIMIFWSKVQLHTLGNIFGTGVVHLHWLALPLTLFGAASLINAINIIDGRDGLSGGILTIAFSSLMCVAYFSGYPAQAMVLAIFIAALLAYLCFNFPLPWRPQAQIFMGDAGSMLLGFVFAWFTINLSQQEHTLAGPAHMLWIAAVPLIDLACVFIKRIKTKRSPFSAGPDHIYNVLEEKGWSRTTVLFILLGATLITNLAAWVMIMTQTPESWVLAGFLVLFLVYYRLNNPKHPSHQRD